MPQYTYREFGTGRLRRFATPFLNADGTPAQTPTISGVPCCFVNNDGEIARGKAGTNPPGDPYSPGAIYSPWESH